LENDQPEPCGVNCADTGHWRVEIRPGRTQRRLSDEVGAASKAIDEAWLAYKVQRLFEHPAELCAMRGRMTSIARPEAATKVLDVVSAAMR
jgi:hypothetical protein